MRERLTVKRLAGYSALGALALVASCILGLSVGSSALGYELLLEAFAGELDDVGRAVLWGARFPRVVFAAAVGASLATAGAAFQAVLRNPLADPYILGVSGGAALGGTLMLTVAAAIGFTTVSVPLGAFVGALCAIALILGVGQWGPPGRLSTYVLLLTGVIFNAFASSVIMFLKSVVSAQKAQELLFYLMGSLTVEGESRWSMALVVGAAIVTTAGILFWARDLNIMSLGDEEARSLGVDVGRVRVGVVVISSLGVAIAVAYTGLIGFVGLVVPHGIRLVVGPDHRLLVPMCAFFGASFLVICDVIARATFAIFGTGLPVGVVTACVGAPLFVFFLRRHLRGVS